MARRNTIAPCGCAHRDDCPTIAPRAPHDTPCRIGWDSLTDAERDVAELVAEGLTNLEIASRMFMSQSTVKTHVESILTKLGMRSRVRLAAETARRIALAHCPRSDACDAWRDLRDILAASGHPIAESLSDRDSELRQG